MSRVTEYVKRRGQVYVRELEVEIDWARVHTDEKPAFRTNKFRGRTRLVSERVCSDPAIVARFESERR